MKHFYLFQQDLEPALMQFFAFGPTHGDLHILVLHRLSSIGTYGTVNKPLLSFNANLRASSSAPHITATHPGHGNKMAAVLSFRLRCYNNPKTLNTYSNKQDVDIFTALTKRYKRKENQ